MPELVELRAGGLIPIARQYPGAQEFVESYRNEFPGADSSYHSAAGYGGCEVLAEAIRRVGSLVRGKLREAILAIDRNTVFGRFKVDRDGRQIGHKMLTIPVTGRQEGERLAGGAGARQAALPDAAVESTPVSTLKATARALGLTIPPSLLMRADQVVE